MTIRNILWLNEGGAIIGEAGTFRAPFRSVDTLFQHVEENIEGFDNWFILVKSNKLINSHINITSNSNIYNLFKERNKRLYFIGMSDNDYSTESEILNNLSSRYGPFTKNEFLSRIQKYKVSLDYNDTKNRFSQNSSKLTTPFNLNIRGNITFVNFEFQCKVDIIVAGNLNTPTFYKCLFLNQVRIYESNGDIPDDITNVSSTINLSVSDRVIINLCMFYNISDNTIMSGSGTGECNTVYEITNRVAALQAVCNAADIYDNVFLNNDIGMLIVSSQDTAHNSETHINNTTINIKNCKIFNSKYEGIIASFPANNNYTNKIINVDCSYTKEGNGFKVRNCNLINCKALWNKFYGFILLGNKYLYKCHAINNQTGILVAQTDNTIFRFPYFKFKNHTESHRDYNSSNVSIHRTTNFYSCSVRGSLGGSGIVFSIYSSYSLFLNCEISGNQGSLESFYDIVKYKRNYYFTGGGIKGFKDNNLFFINCSIVGNLGYGICIIDDIKKVLSPTQRTYLDHNGNELSREGSDQYNSYFVVSSCELNGSDYQIKSFETTNSDIYSSVASGTSSTLNYRPYTIPSSSSDQHCRLYNNIKEAESYIGHIILINSIVSTNRGGQIIKLFDFQNKFTNRYLEINSLIDNYKSDKFFTLPKNVCAWNPYQGIYEIGNNNSTQKIGLYDMVTIYNSISPTSGSHLLYRGGGPEGGIFKAFKTPENVDNARDDLDLRFRSTVNKDNPTYIYRDFNNNQKKILEGCNLFNGDSINFINQINNIISKKIDNTNLDSATYNFYNLYFHNSLSYLPDISHYKFMGHALETSSNMLDSRDDNFQQISNKFFEIDNDIMSASLIQTINYQNTHKQFLEIRQAKMDNNPATNIQKYLKDLLSYDFDELDRNINSNDYYIGCFEKHNYCNYSFNTVGREFDKNNKEFTSRVNCCAGQDSSDCTNQSISTGIGNFFPSGLERSLIVDYTDQEISFEQEEMSSICQAFQDNINFRENIGVLPDLSNPQIAEDSCIIPNFDMYDFNGTYFESRFICGNDCNFNWFPWTKMIESEESTVSLARTDLDVFFRTGKLIKLNQDTKDDLQNSNIRSHNYIDVEKIYPNKCPHSGEFELDETNDELFCDRTSPNEAIQNWYCKKKNKNELPLIPDGCPSFGGKECPASNVQFTMVNSGETPDPEIGNTSFSIKNVVDDILNPNSGISVDSVVTEIQSSDEIDPSNPIYLQSKCLEDGYITPSRGLSNRIRSNSRRDNNPYEPKEEKIPYKKLIIIIVIMVILVIGTILI